MRRFAEYTLWDRKTPKAITSSTDATPVVVTCTAHGFSTGDIVMIYGHTTNISANGMYKITKITDNTFSLQDRNSGANIAGSGAGAGSGGVAIIAPQSIPFVMDFKSVTLQISTEGTATMTVKFAMSQGIPPSVVDPSYGDIPNFGATVSATNPYTLDAVTENANGATLPGATGLVVAGTDVTKNYEAYVQGVKYFMPLITSWSAGAITLKLVGYYE